MGYSVTRLTLYAIISSIEEDLRGIIVTYLGSQGTSKDVLGIVVWEKASARYQKEMDEQSTSSHLEEIIQFTDFPELVEVLNRNKQSLPSGLGRYFQNHTQDIAELTPIRNRVAHSRPLNFEDFPNTFDITAKLVKSREVPWNNLQETLLKLKNEPGFVLSLNIPVVDTEPSNTKHNLPMPDFDETGFIGRKKYAEDVKKACMLGPYPVVTIIGEGGVGKTALALEVAHDILQDSRCQFDAVVWTSSKTAQLTPQEIVRIENAICDSIGMFRNVATNLGAISTAQDPFYEILEYMREFKILLIIDNLETVLDDRIMEFLGKLPIGSKVLITSRIGLGAFEYRIQLNPLEEGEAVQLLRAVARARNLADLTAVSNRVLADYCRRMKNNPGYIKWFVAAVQAGRRPEEVLAKPEIFLDYCMSNVYQYLKEASRTVLRTMLCVPGPLGQAELAFLSGLDVPVIQRGITQLLTTSMLETTRSAKNNSYETRYELSSLARSYLAKKHPASSAELKDYVKQRRSLTVASEQLKAEHQTNPYSAYSISLRSPGDALIGKYLLEALAAAKKADIDTARDIINKARDLAPGYFEVSRVEAWIEGEAGNYSASQNAYETAVELEPASAPLRLWYAGFLSRSLSDLEGASTQLAVAERLDPGNFQVMLETARVDLYLKKWADADRKISALQEMDGLTERDFRRVYDLRLQYHQRIAESYYSQRENIKALSSLEDLKSAYITCPEKLRDRQMTKKLSLALPKLLSLKGRIEYELQSVELLERANNLLSWYDEILKDKKQYQIDRETEREELSYASTPNYEEKETGTHRTLSHKVYYGYISRRRDGFGFIREDDGEDFFFHRTALTNPDYQWRDTEDKDRVSFTLDRDNTGRPKAVNVNLIRRSVSPKQD